MPPKGYAKTNPRDLLTVLKGNRDDAVKLAQSVGVEKAKLLLEQAEKDLANRLQRTEGLAGLGNASFTEDQLRLTLKTIRDGLVDLKGGMKSLIMDQGQNATEQAASNVFDYMGEAGSAFGDSGGITNIRTAMVLDNARRGVNSSILRRLAAETGPDGKPGRGILDRYGNAVIGQFEEKLQVGLLARTPWREVRNMLISSSPFLQEAPGYWAERIVRTETIGAYNRANWEVMRGVDEDLGDMCKILCATFDNRTGADSYAVHGQIRKTDEAFETWQGFVQHPPARPNDREVIVPHRIAWPIPPYLTWKNDGEIVARWRALGNKRPVPPRPLMTTIELEKFGKKG